MAQWAPVSQPMLSARPRNSWRSTALWWVMLVLSLAIVGYGATYFLAIPRNPHFARYILPLRLHIAGGMGALLLGPWQFSQRLRARALNVHRWMGRAYLLEVGLGSIAGFVMACVSSEGMPTHLGFGILAVLWFGTGLQAYRSVRKGDIQAHREWMIRNFALTLAAVTLRIELPVMLALLHWPFRVSYITVSWLCWVPNILVAEWMVRGRRLRLLAAI
ncbi:MAG: DUF2306 domain-containing protein [Terriglobales bacterium]